jgi:cytochrome c-type biogenesis protein CcmH
VKLALVLMLLGQYAPQHVGTTPLDGEREARVQKLGKLYRCPVCQGLSIADSPSPTARAQLDKLRQLVAEGKSDLEIKDYFVSRYGEWALLEPEKNQVVLWFGPGVLLLIGFLIIAMQVKKKGKPAPPAPVEELRAEKAEVSDYLATVRADLEK